MTKSAATDLAKLKGTWIRELEGKTYIFHFNREKYAVIFEFAEGTTTATGTVTLDPTTTPKHLDVHLANGTGRGEHLKGQTARSIYELDGDTLKMCANRPGQDGYPERFPAQEGEGEYLHLVYKRAH